MFSIILYTSAYHIAFLSCALHFFTGMLKQLAKISKDVENVKKTTKEKTCV